MASSSAKPSVFFPKADAAILSCRLAPAPEYPEIVGPIYDSENVHTPVLPWSAATEKQNYPPPKEPYGPASAPDRHFCVSDRYLRASLAKNERLRLSMLWYYTRDIFKETEFLSGLQEKVCIAQESSGWEFAIIGILDMNFYVRLATVGVPLGILPRGETICAHAVSQPPGSVFLLPSLLEDWRFEESPYVESGGLRAYAGAPLRLQNENGDTVCLGSICVASPERQEPLTRAQQTTLARLADWVVSDIVQLTRARRQRERRRMVELLAMAQKQSDDGSDEPVLQILLATYPNAVVSLQSAKSGHIEVEGRGPVPISDLMEGLWEDFSFIDDFVATTNHLEPPVDRVVRVIAAQCESVEGPSLLSVASKDFRLVFDDIDAWFVQTCAGIISERWHKRVLNEVMLAKEKFLRGFSHQLRTPLHGILGSVELLAEELKSRGTENSTSQATALLEATEAVRSGGEHSVYLDAIKTAGRDLIAVVNSMITLNRWADVAITERQYATYTLHDVETELANETMKAISGDVRYNASVFFNHDIPPDHCSIRTDLSLLRDSVLPLIINAIQSTAEGVVVVTISARPHIKELVVDVKDTGRGIHVDHHKRIFELYEQVDAYSTGAGLGLTLASKFAALLRGTVTLVSSEVDSGSHFRATFQGVELTSSDSSLLAEPLVPKPANLPELFHVIPSKTQRLSLSDHFAKFLTCHGMRASDDIKNSLIVFDFVADSEEHQATISRIPSDQAAICLVPFLERDAQLDESYKNIVYVHEPFLTRTMSSALRRADELLPSIQADKEDSTSPSLEPTITVADANEAVGETPSTGQVSDIDKSAIPEATSVKIELLLRPAQEGVTTISRDDLVPATISPKPVIPTKIPISIPNSPRLPTKPFPTTLLVDDNAINLRVMQMYCTKRNMPYICAKDGLEAITLFRAHQTVSYTTTAPPISLVLMDLQMPVCDGIEATRQIRALESSQGWDPSVLFIVTGQDSPADRKAASAAGAHEYYVKPISMKILDAGLKSYFS
ncbi:histidine kinase HHK3 [Aaosphaeria arxii CBS 175.79]|uniref:histidine kinase n=1 Tax=Aaosphaeria arxii CBS 175.79 TaxID=1450172 RepID=A0A6A5XCJ4_9PLEO|nr:histidine kinase HHK3 [Aaosphaeria arxii CBS 175.79]KAF2010527.1 histidine kinase HHK3 [Aaosphaeria arxii CBS 175.79]